MVQQILGVLFFYKKILIPSFIISIFFGLYSVPLTGIFFFRSAAFSYVLVSIVFHYLIYEVRYIDEYYFYYNLGLSRLTLWISTVLLSSFISIPISLL